MLVKLLREKLRPVQEADLHRHRAAGGGQTTAALLLPTLNARIIDDGVLPGDLGFIRSEGALMLFVTLVQGAFAAAAVFVGARDRDGLRPRPARPPCSTRSPSSPPVRWARSGRRR